MTAHSELLIRAKQAVIDGQLRPAQVAISGGRITAIHDLNAQVSADEVVQLGTEQVLLPGFVDSHVHINEPGRTHWEGFASATRAALRGGTTTLIDMPLNSLPPTTSVEALHIKQEAARGQCFVDVGFWGGAVPGNGAQQQPLHEAGVFGFKCFLIDSGVPEFPPLSPAQLRTDLARTASLGALMIVHAERAEEIDAAPHPGGPAYRDFLNSRPDAAEVEAIRLVIETVRATGGRAHILHLSSAQALPLIREAKREGLPLTAETCPHYLSFTAETIRDGSTAHKCCPPIRTGANQDLLWEALADGTIDIVVSDHSPSTPDLKIPDFEAAWGGIASVQLAPSAVWTAARERGFAITDVVRWMSTGPADLVGLSGKGRIAVGAQADLIAYDPDARTRVDAPNLEHKNAVTAYQGLELSGLAQRVWLRGEQIDTDRPRGRFLSRGDS
ncbi:allantoinase AllB [Dermacoccaceae bacterium W4C1]